MNFLEAIQAGFTNYVEFDGRASRSEFWYWILFTIIINFIAGLMDASLYGSTDAGWFYACAQIGLLIPGISASIRRMHDTERSGWWVLVLLVPLVGLLAFIWWACEEGTDGPNLYGPDPLA